MEQGICNTYSPLPNHGEEVTTSKAEPVEDEPSSAYNHGEHNHGECGQVEANGAPTANEPLILNAYC